MAKDKKKNASAPKDPEQEEAAVSAETAEESEAQAEPAAAEEPAEDIRDEKAEWEARLKEEQDKYLRLAAEYDNYRKRSIKERDALRDDIRSAAIADLLPVYDNLERALSAECSDEAFYKGIEMTMSKLRAIFESMGVSEIPAVGETFDPTLHNAVMHIEDEQYGPGEIVQEFQKGFRLGDKIIRFSMVQVAN
ncbi:MAG: nucleotide exchange factor GrpE [Oscillospiraceae bacterium]|nr:nucleotide exchange factor GrpE [Oscillospiraceae bacterium]